MLCTPIACSAQPAGADQENARMSQPAASPPQIPLAGSVETPYGGKKQPLGYYRQPAIHGNTIVFVSEGDLWKASATGGVASRLTTHHSTESNPIISPDGSTIAFTAQYEGPSELYTMPITGGLPARRTFDGWGSTPVTWLSNSKIVFATSLYSTLPNTQLVILDTTTGERKRIPLSHANDASFDDSGQTIFFQRLGQGSHNKRYKGGTAHQIWKFGDDDSKDEAVDLTADYAGTNRNPMWYHDRLYFASDRDDTMNIWSMDRNGKNLKKHTHHVGWQIQSPSLGDGRIVYQYGADLRIYDINKNSDTAVAISLDTDFDQMREKWVTNPTSWITAAHISPEGDSVVMTARGDVFTSPQKDGRLINVTRRPDVRFRDARYMPDGKSLLALSDQSGEVELWTLPPDGIGEWKQLTNDGAVLRWQAIPSPDGKWIAHTDKNWKLWLFNLENQTSKLIDQSDWGRFTGLAWSSDSKWLAYNAPQQSEYKRIRLYSIKDQNTTNLTSERFNSTNPAWGPDGKWLYFFSDRSFRSLAGSPWGLWQPEPLFDKTTRIYAIALQKNLRSPFAPDNELTRAEAKKKKEEEKKKKEEPEETKEKKKQDENSKPDNGNDTKEQAEQTDQDENTKSDDADKQDEEKKDEKEIEIDLDGIQNRIYDVPVERGNYGNLFTAGGAIYYIDSGDITNQSRDLKAIKITNEDPKPKTIASGISSVEKSANAKKLLIRKGSSLHIVNANGENASLDHKSQVQLDGWAFSLTPRDEWRQMFTDAWRLERDYFYDPNMHGVDWPAMLERYLPLVDRVSDRDELADAIAQMVSEISALHTFVYGGDRRRGTENIQPASLGAILARDDAAGGYRIDRIFKADPDFPNFRSPLDQLEQNINEGDIITKINGIDVLSVRDVSNLLRNQVGKQVLLHIRDKNNKPDDEEKKFIVNPISQGAASSIRYHEWEYNRRKIVEEKSDDQIGYIHLRAMGARDVATWARDYQPIFMKKGLIVDVRHNGGGNIDSWILNRLIRKVWFYWKGRVGKPTWNMQQAFRGHIVFLCDENTGSDGEAVTEGFRRLGLGPVIGVRTWGGEIWLSSSNSLVDRGIATAAEWGVYGPEGEWLIEGRGVEPDIVVQNMPHATFNGSDVQLDTAIDYLLDEISKDPRNVPPHPAYPDKSSPDNRSEK